MFYPVKLGLRSLFYRIRQYVSLLLVCIVGIGVSLFCISLIKGMLASLSDKARIYYGGDLQFMGGRYNLDMDDYPSYIEQLENIFKEDAVVSPRYDFDADFSRLYFEGTGVRQRVIKGVDFAREQKLFERFNYVEGSAKDMAGSNGILLSMPIARMLEASAGDEITFIIKNIHGYTESVSLVVKGIFKDSSLFGMFTSYVDIHCLQKAYGVPEGYANRIAVSFNNKKPSYKQINLYQKQLSDVYNMFPLVNDKYKFYDRLLGGSFDKPTFALIPLNANLQELKVLISAMTLIAAFIIVTLVTIIVAGISSTYRVIVMKRINELGIYMAIGMKRSGIFISVILESFFLLFTGGLFGFLFSILLNKIAGLFNFSFIPAFDVFLVDGHLVPLVSAGDVLFIEGTVFLFTLIAISLAVKKAVSMTPAAALGANN